MRNVYKFIKDILNLNKSYKKRFAEHPQTFLVFDIFIKNKFVFVTFFKAIVYNRFVSY